MYLYDGALHYSVACGRKGEKAYMDAKFIPALNASP